jgi:glycosyltransferase involved in cell wall biosynthesis
LRPRVLLCPPLYGWAFDNIARQLQRHLGARFDFTVKTLKELTASERYDLTVTMLWTQAERVRFRLGEGTRSIACLFDHASTSGGVGKELFRRMALHIGGLVAGSPALVALAGSLGAPGAFLCQDGVDLDLFALQPLPERFTLGWCGNVAIGDGTYKGLELIRAAAAACDAPLLVQAFEKRIPHGDMPSQFYRHVSAYVCASIAEGTPNPVLESLACGRPVITTRVGLTDQVVQPGVTGLFVDRNASAIEVAIREVRGWGSRAVACRAAVSAHG